MAGNSNSDFTDNRRLTSRQSSALESAERLSAHLGMGAYCYLGSILLYRCWSVVREPRDLINMPGDPKSRPGRDRRSQPRYRTNQPAMLVSKAVGSASVQVLEIGRFGLRISVPIRLPLRDEVEIRLADTTVLGIVRYCRCIRAIEFHAGIEIRHDDPSGESSLDRSHVLRKARSTG